MKTKPKSASKQAGPRVGEIWRYKRIPSLIGRVWYVGPGDTVNLDFEDTMGAMNWVSTVAAFLERFERVEIKP